ncbi:MAG: hypothetical protein O2887_07220 [Bacteroidetes bacterium]|nr:hypothetical protein [Bacteroidota bacterium]MDA1120270.1 hypothetical protein [Bacteroidota bacterium]
MDENKRLNMRMSQLEELMANTLKSVDRLVSENEKFREYAYENTKVVNGILKKMDDREEEMKNYMKQQDKRWEKQDKINDNLVQTLVDIRNSLK